MSKVNESNQLDNLESQIWRFYDDLDGTSILCESQEECEHLVTKFAEAAKRSFTTDCQDFYPFYEDAHFTEDDTITPMGYERTVYALITVKLNQWGMHSYRQRIAHYFYYHDTDEEAERERIKKESIYKDTDSINVPTLTATVRGETCKFVANSVSPTDWTTKNDESSNYLRIDKEMVKECIEELGILLDCVPKSDNLLKIMEDQKETFLINLKPSSFKFVISKVLDLITPF